MSSYTEKVSLSGTALSFLLYECFNSVNTQEGFLIGNVTTEITNHISDSQSDNARQDTRISVKTVLPLPSLSLFYLPSGRIKEDILSELLSNTASEVVGWYKYRRNSNIKPSFRDKLIAKGLQKYFEKCHGKKNFVTCNLTSKTSSISSTHTFTYRFGKINCFNMYEYIEDVTENLGEKLTGYKKGHQVSSGVFNEIVKECDVKKNNTNDAILRIQAAVDVRLGKEARIAAKNEATIRELEVEIKQMTSILLDKQSADLQTNYDKIIEEKLFNREMEMAEECVNALKTPPQIDILNAPNLLMNSNNFLDTDKPLKIINNDLHERSPSPVLKPTISKVVNYAAALKSNVDKASTSKTNHQTEDLISFEIDNISRGEQKSNHDMKKELNCRGDSSPEY